MPKKTSSRDCWRTPPAFFAHYHSIHRFTVDGAADKTNTLLPKFWTEKMDALSLDWSGERVWINPPFSNIIGFHRKAVQEALHHNVFSVLLNRMDANAAWCTHFAHRYGVMQFPTPRVKYINPGNIQVSSKNKSEAPDFSSVITVYNPPLVQCQWEMQEISMRIAKGLPFADLCKTPEERYGK